MKLFGGIETFLLNIIRKTSRESFCHDFLYTYPSEENDRDREIIGLGGRIFTCSQQFGLRHNPLSFSKHFSSIVQDTKYQIVHSHLWGGNGYVLRCARNNGIPVRISHSHSAPLPTRNVLRQIRHSIFRHWIHNNATHLLAVSNAAGQSLYRQDWGNLRCEVFPPAIDLSPFKQEYDSSVVRCELGIPQRAFVIGTVGRCDICKNHNALLEIASILKNRHVDVYVLIVGYGPLLESIKLKSVAMGLERNVICVGVRSDVPRLLKGAMDVFVLPSLFEGLSLALVEAQAAGLPCVISDRIPQEAVVVEDRISIVGLNRGYELWADAIVQARTAKLARRLSLSIVEKSVFNIDVCIVNLENLYWRAVATLK